MNKEMIVRAAEIYRHKHHGDDKQREHRRQREQILAAWLSMAIGDDMQRDMLKQVIEGVMENTAKVAK